MLDGLGPAWAVWARLHVIARQFLGSFASGLDLRSTLGKFPSHANFNEAWFRLPW